MRSWFQDSIHFTLQQLNGELYACIHRPGGAAYSNAGIIDLGDRTMLVDAFDTMAAGRDLRQTAEALFDRPVDLIVLTHPHSDHWIGASAFEGTTNLLAHETTLRVSREWGDEILKGCEDPTGWEQWIRELEEQLAAEQDERVRASLENSIARVRYTVAEMSEFQPRYADQTFEGSLQFQGSRRSVELRSLGRGHSEDDAVLLLPGDGIAFIGDVGFFDSQPFLGYCDIDLYRRQMVFFKDAGFDVLVPGHGPVGNYEDIALQLSYLDVMQDLVARVVQAGGSLEEAKQITLPEPFDRWLFGGINRFEANVRYLYTHLGGEIPEE